MLAIIHLQTDGWRFCHTCAADLTTPTIGPVCIELSGLRKVPQFVTHKAWPQLHVFIVFPPWGIHTPYQARHWETWEYPSIINPVCRQQHGKTTVSNACLLRNSLTHCFEPDHNTRSTRSPMHIIATSGHNKLDSFSHLVWSLNSINQIVHTFFGAEVLKGCADQPSSVFTAIFSLFSYPWTMTSHPHVRTRNGLKDWSWSF